MVLRGVGDCFDMIIAKMYLGNTCDPTSTRNMYFADQLQNPAHVGARTDLGAILCETGKNMFAWCFHGVFMV